MVAIAQCAANMPTVYVPPNDANRPAAPPTLCIPYAAVDGSLMVPENIPGCLLFAICNAVCCLLITITDPCECVAGVPDEIGILLLKLMWAMNDEEAT